MQNSSYPTLLKRKATLFASLNRKDLMVVAAVLLLITIFNIQGVVGLILVAMGLVISKLTAKWIPKGFESGIGAPVKLEWRYKCEGLNE